MKRLNKILAFVIALVIAQTFTLSIGKVFAVDGLTAQPTGVCMTYYNGINSRGFAWQTATTVTNGKLVVAKGQGDLADWANAVTVDSTYVDFNDYRCHKAHVTNLDAGKYSYKVGSDSAWSDIGTFTVDLEDDDKVRFVYVTDSQETSEEGFKQWEKTLNTATQVANPDFIAFAGDLVDNSHAGWGSDMTKVIMKEWSYAFDVPKHIIMNYPFMSASGNHERAGYSFVNHSNIDYVKAASTGGYYSFVYDNLHFIVLDSNEANNTTAFAEQIAWLESELQNSTSNWKVVMLHIGPYSTGDHSNDSEAIYIRSIIPAICAKYEVDLVLQGHDHVYTRTLPYYYGENENGRIPNRTAPVLQDGMMWSIEPDGTYYATINYAGTKSYPPEEYDASRIFVAESPVNGKLMSQQVKERMFADVQIDGNTLVFKAYMAKEDGSSELYDYFAVKKNTYEEAQGLIDALPESVTTREAVALKEAKNSFDLLNERAVLRLGSERVQKLERLLSTFNLEYALNAYEVIQVVDLLNIETLNEDFWQNYANAKNLYYALGEEEKELVLNREKLLSLEETISQKFLVEKVQELVNGIDNASNKEEARVIALQAYNLLTEQGKAQITGADKLLAEEVGGSSNQTYIYVIIAVVLLLAVGAIGFVIYKKRGMVK